MAGRQSDETLTRGPAAKSDDARTGAGFAGSPVSADRTLTMGIQDATLTHVGGTGTGELVDKVDWEVGDVIDGKYEVTAELGCGGMGIVYRVHHREWDIDMAVKVPLANQVFDGSYRREWNIDMAVKLALAKLATDETSKARFIREAQTWVDLGLHPHIVQCWYVRELGGVPRLFVDFIPGGSLKQWIKQGKVKPGEWGKIIDLMIQACDGLSYAHEKGMVHRDVKPANMLMAEDGRLCVTDFGLVKVAGVAEIRDGGTSAASTDGQHTLTRTGSGMGTPEYGAPEQWGDAKKVDARADIYALGIVLFELCVGRRPFDDGSHSEPDYVLIGRHLSTPAPDARQMNKDVPEALAALIAKCLAKKPDDRPGSMAALRADLAQAYGHVVGEPYTREAPRAAELRADALNNRAVSLWDLGSEEAAFAAWAEALKLDGQHPEAIYNKGLLEYRRGKVTDLEVVKAVRAAKQSNKRAGLYLGYVNLELAAADEAEKELAEALEDARLAKDGAAWRALGDARMAQENYATAKEAYEKALERMPGDPLVLRNLALASKNTRECSGRVEFPWWHCVRAFEGHQWVVTAVAVTPDGRFAVSGSWDKTLRLWELATGGCLRTFRGHTSYVETVAVTPDGRFAVSGSKDKALRLWELGTGACLHTFEGHTNEVNTVAVTPDGRFAVSGSDDKTLRLWELSTGACLRTFEGHTDGVNVVAVTPDGRFAVSGSKDKTLRLWELSTGACLRTFEGHTGSVDLVWVAPDGRFALSGTWRTLSFWELGTGACPRTFRTGAGEWNAVAVTPDNRFGLSGSDAKTVCLWGLSTGTFLRTFEGHTGKVNAVAVTPDGRFALSGSWDNTLRLWELGASTMPHKATLQVCRKQSHAEAEAWKKEFSQHLGRAKAALACNQADKAYRHLTLARAVPGYSRDPQALALNATLAEALPVAGLRAAWFVRVFEGWTVALTPDGRLALSGNAGNILRLWDLGTGACLRTFEGHTNRVTAVAVTPDGRFALSGSMDNTLRLWDLGTGACLRTFEGHTNCVMAVAVTPDGRFALSGSMDHTLRLWDLGTGACLRTFEGHTSTMSAVAVTPDARFVLSGTTDYALRLWDLGTGACLRTFEGHTNRVTAVAVTPDGHFALSGSSDHTLRLWDLGTGACLRTFEGHTNDVEAVAMTPDGRFALSGSLDSTVRLWNLGTGACLHTFEGHTKRVRAVAVTPDGRFAISGSFDQTVRLWELDWELDAAAFQEAKARREAEEKARRDAAQNPLCQHE